MKRRNPSRAAGALLHAAATFIALEGPLPGLFAEQAGALLAVAARFEEAADLMRPVLALYIGGMGSRERNYYNRLFALYGFERAARDIQDLFLSGRREDAVRAVSDDMIDLVTIIGPLPECRRRLAELADCGVGEVALDLRVPGDDPAQLLAALTALAPVG